MDRERFFSKAPPRREKSLNFSVGVLGVLTEHASSMTAGEPFETDLEEVRRGGVAMDTALLLAKGSVLRKRGCCPFLVNTEAMTFLALTGVAVAGATPGLKDAVEEMERRRAKEVAALTLRRRDEDSDDCAGAAEVLLGVGLTFIVDRVGDGLVRLLGVDRFTMAGLPTYMTETTRAVISWLRRRGPPDGLLMPLLLEASAIWASSAYSNSLPLSHSKSEKSSAEDEASSSDERYTSCGVGAASFVAPVVPWTMISFAPPMFSPVESRVLVEDDLEVDLDLEPDLSAFLRGKGGGGGEETAESSFIGDSIMASFTSLWFSVTGWRNSV